MADRARRGGPSRRALIALRVLLLLGWAASFLVERSTDDTRGMAVVGVLFLASVAHLWLTLKRTPPTTATPSRPG